MNILQMEDMVKGLPDQRLIQEARQPSGQTPLFLLVSEVQRRADMRKRFKQEEAETPEGTISDQVLNGGIGSMNQPPQQPPHPSQMPPRAPEQMPPLPGQGLSPNPAQFPPPAMPNAEIAPAAVSID
jgi:hypothetical protein